MYFDSHRKVIYYFYFQQNWKIKLLLIYFHFSHSLPVRFVPHSNWMLYCINSYRFQDINRSLILMLVWLFRTIVLLGFCVKCCSFVRLSPLNFVEYKLRSSWMDFEFNKMIISWTNKLELILLLEAKANLGREGWRIYEMFVYEIEFYFVDFERIFSGCCHVWGWAVM